MSKPRSNIKVNVNPVADAYRSSPDEKRLEFSATRKDVQEDGSCNSLMGGLISFRVIRSTGPGSSTPEDKLIVTVYRTDPNVEVHWELPEQASIPHTRLAPGEFEFMSRTGETYASYEAKHMYEPEAQAVLAAYRETHRN